MVNPSVEIVTCVGLLVVEGEKPIPLEGVSVEATIKDQCTRVTLTQRYRNQEAQPIEAVYVFPLDEEAAICGFEAMIGEIHVVGEVKEKEEAFEKYDDALAHGHGAYLLDQEKPDVFTASVGNIPPGKEVLVKITYVAEVGLEGDAVRFVLPTTVSPRYAPQQDQVGVGRSTAEAVNPTTKWTVPYGLDLKVHLDMPSAIRGVESPTHPISTEIDGKAGTVTLGNRTTQLDRDFVLLVRTAEPQKPRAWVEVDEDGERTAMVAFQPEFEVEEAPSEIVFVLDQSGSMDGSSIVEARNALQLCLRSLPEGTRFNIVGFGSSHRMLFPESMLYGDESLQKASERVKNMRADLGGTEILGPLKAILGAKPNPELPRQLFVLTDGQVSNTEEVISLVRKHSHTTRVFTFGIGAGASHHLVKGMARAGGGSAEFISPGERIEKKVLRQLRRALVPALTDVKVDWGGLEVEQAPYRVPPVFAGGRVLVYGFIDEAAANPVEVTLNAHGTRGAMSFKVPIDVQNAVPGTLIGTLAARTMIRDLEEEASVLHAQSGSRQKRRKDERDKLVKEQIVRLGVAYGLVSKHTSFVAVEMRDTPAEGELQLRKVPVALTSGWGGLDPGVDVGAVTLDAAPISMDCAFAAPAEACAPDIMCGDAGTMDGLAPDPGEAFEMEEKALDDALESVAGETHQALDKLVELQSADGSWDLTAELAEVLGRSPVDLERYRPNASGELAMVRRAWATALAVVWLDKEASWWKDEWTLLERKARKWLAQCPSKLPPGEDWLAAAATVLSLA